MSRGVRALTAFLGVHLALVALAALDFDYHLSFERWPRILSRPVGFYGALSGANGRYGFFAPEVGAQLRVRYVVTDRAGGESSDVFLHGGSEADLRLGNIANGFATREAGEGAGKLRRAVAASLAGKIFEVHAEATIVALHIEAYDLPTMVDYRRGDRPQWRELYQATFTRAGKLALQGAPR